MRSTLYSRLLAVARRECRDPGIVEDLVQEALLAAVLAGRDDFTAPRNASWLVGTVRNRARMAARTAMRQRLRDGQWHLHTAVHDHGANLELTNFVSQLPPALGTLAALIYSGHNRREVAYLLGLPDTAMRQRIAALKRRLMAAEVMMPPDFPGLSPSISYGLIRNALLEQLSRQAGGFASHDPDGHLFVVRCSRNADLRQQAVQANKENSS